MFPAVPGSWVGSNFLLRSHPVVVKSLSIMVLDLPVRVIKPARVLLTVGPHRPGQKVLLGLPVPTGRLPVRLDLAGLVARAEPDVRGDFHAPVARPAPVDRAVVLAVRPVRVDLVARLVALADLPVPE
jgi:hypothetical protein